jgi:hypothetical protein
VVKQAGSGFCHREGVGALLLAFDFSLTFNSPQGVPGCFGAFRGLVALERTVHQRIAELAAATVEEKSCECCCWFFFKKK